MVSYLPPPIWGDPAEIRGHSNVWESSEIIRCFTRLGFVVDAIAWNDTTFIPPAAYTAVFDIHCNLLRYAGKQTRKIFHVTGSYPEYSNHAELERLDAVRMRRSCNLMQRRQVSVHDRHLFNMNLAAAEMVTLIGNDVTLATFPENMRAKIRPVIATGAWLPSEVTEADLSSRCREFLWFNGRGAVHKGLDLVLEVFARHPELTLHVVGPYLRERDFVEAYRSELFNLPNIHSHGFLYPGGPAFRKLLQRVRLFINASCSEGISTSAITCMQAGLVPIMSSNCGISMPEGVGWLLRGNSLEEIEATVIHSTSLDDKSLTGMAVACRRLALESYSRSIFSVQMADVLTDVMGKQR